MKIKIVFCHLFNDYSGSPKVLRSIVDSVSTASIPIKIYFGSGGDGFLSGTRIPSANYWYRHMPYRPLTFLTYFFSQLLLFVKLLFDKEIDKDAIVYVNTLLPFGAALYGRFTGKKVIYHIHEISISPLLLRWSLIQIVKLTSTLNIYVSNSHMQNLLIRGVDSRYVYNSLDPVFKIRATKSKYKYRKGEIFSVLMIASLRTYKGVPEFINLAKTLLDYKDIQFDLVLNDDKKSIEKYFSSFDVPHNLNIHSRIYDTAIFYSKASVLLNLSRVDQWVETFGLTILEAMAFGVPVIVPPVGGPSELVEDGIQGYLVDSRDEDLLRNRLLNLYNDESLCREMSRAGEIRSDDFCRERFNESIFNVLNI